MQLRILQTNLECKAASSLIGDSQLMLDSATARGSLHAESGMPYGTLGGYAVSGTAYRPAAP